MKIFLRGLVLASHDGIHAPQLKKLRKTHCTFYNLEFHCHVCMIVSVHFRYLLGNGFICTGKWFAKPLSEKNERG